MACNWTIRTAKDGISNLGIKNYVSNATNNPRRYWLWWPPLNTICYQLRQHWPCVKRGGRWRQNSVGFTIKHTTQHSNWNGYTDYWLGQPLYPAEGGDKLRFGRTDDRASPRDLESLCLTGDSVGECVIKRDPAVAIQASLLREYDTQGQMDRQVTEGVFNQQCFIVRLL